MINSNIAYSFNQCELSIQAMCAYIKLKLQELVPNLPVFIMNSGDFSFLVGKKFEKTDNKEVYLKTPRVVLKIEDIQQNSSEDTNQYNRFIYKFDKGDGLGEQVYTAVVRRKAYNFQISLSFVSPNFIEALNHIEVMATLTAHDNVYTYEFLGNTCQGAFSIQQSGNEIPSIDMGQGGTRNITTNYMLEQQIHVIVPRPESIMLLSDTEINTVVDDIIVNGENNHIDNETIKLYEDDNDKSPYIDVVGNDKRLRNFKFK